MSSMSVDTSSHVITHIRANFADHKDSLNLIDLVRQTQSRLKKNQLKMDTLLADAGYSNGENYKYLESQNIEGFIPLHGQYEGTREGFTYEPEHDRWRCSQGKYVTMRTIKYQKNHPEKHYLTKRSDCKGCPIASKCIGKSHEKRLRITIYKEYYDRALERSKTHKAKYYKTLRQSTVEPVFGTLINHLGLRKINTRGIENANKNMLMAAIAYNLKKVLKHSPGDIVSHVQSGCGQLHTACFLLFEAFLGLFQGKADNMEESHTILQPRNLNYKKSLKRKYDVIYATKGVVQQLHVLPAVAFLSNRNV